MSANKHTPVDVLAVMDEASQSQVIRDDRDDMREARSAVAELIEVAAGIEGLARLAAAPLRDYKAAVDRLTAALARVRGVQ